MAYDALVFDAVSARPAMTLRPLSKSPQTPLGDALPHPGARVLLYCRACSWAKSYSVARLIARLEQLRRGGELTPVSSVSGWVQWPCPACRRMHWGARFMTAASGFIDERDAQRRAIRNVRS